VHLSEHKLVTKIAKLSVVIPLSVLNEVHAYRDGLRKYRKLDTSDEESGNKTASTPQEQ
jgi:hypothetical protein